RHAIPLCIALLAGLVLPVTNVFAATADEPSTHADPPRQYIYGWLGALDAGNAWTANDPDDGRATSDLGTLPFGGAASQRIRGDRFQYGYEGGGLITWKSRRSAFLATSNELRVKVRSSLFV